MKLEDLEQEFLDPIEKQTISISRGYVYFGTISPYQKNIKTIRGVSHCRSYLHDDLRSEYFKYEDTSSFKTTPCRLILGFNKEEKILINNFLTNITWFNSWQKVLDLQKPIIKQVSFKNPESKFDKNIRLYLELDPIWQNSILQNSFISFILKTMCYHIYETPLNWDKLNKELLYQEQEYLKIISKKLFIYYLNHIHTLNTGLFGKQKDDYFTAHEQYGFVKQSYNQNELKPFKEWFTNWFNLGD